MMFSTYDDDLLNEVKNFQLQQGLAADGIVGPVTIIHLNTHAGQKVPLLIPAAASSPLASPTSPHAEQG